MKGRIWLHVVRIEIQSLVSRKKVSVREMIKEYAYIYIYISNQSFMLVVSRNIS